MSYDICTMSYEYVLCDEDSYNIVQMSYDIHPIYYEYMLCDKDSYDIV